MITDDFVAYAGKVHAHFDHAKLPDELRSLVSSTISMVARECMNDGARLIGHIKCIAEVDSGKYIACSVVSAENGAVCRGELDGSSKTLNLIMNVLIYGLDKPKVEAIVVRSAKSIFHGKGVHIEFEDLEFEGHDHCEDDHEHDHDH
jgi:ribosomal protein L14